MPRSRRPSQSQPLSSCCWSACRASPLFRCISDVSTRQGRRRAWRRGATTDRPRCGPSLPTARRCNSAATANTSSPASPRDRRCSRGSPSRGRPLPHWSRVSADRGSATLVAVAMVAVCWWSPSVGVPRLGGDRATPCSGGGRPRRAGGSRPARPRRRRRMRTRGRSGRRDASHGRGLRGGRSRRRCRR